MTAETANHAPENREGSCPKARREKIICEQVMDEYVIYDLERHKVHALNPTASQVWQWCDGMTPRNQLANKLAHQLEIGNDDAEAVLDLALDRLQAAQLLAPSSAVSVTTGCAASTRSTRKRASTPGWPSRWRSSLPLDNRLGRIWIDPILASLRDRG